MFKYLFLIFCILFHLDSNGQEHELEVRIFNASKFKIENLKLKLDSEIIEFNKIEPKSFSKVKIVKSLWKDNCYDLTVSRKYFLKKYYWAHQICQPIDHIGDVKIDRGRYILKLNIKRVKKINFFVETEYLSTFK